MHALGIIVLWVALQVTVVVGVIFLVMRFSEKSEPLFRSRVILAGIGAVFLLSGLGVSPWPSWSKFLAAENPEPSQKEMTARENPAAPALPELGQATKAEPDANAAKAELAEIESPWSAAWSAFLEQIKKPQPVRNAGDQETAPTETAFTLPALVGIVFLAGVFLGLVRLFAGVWLLRREVAGSRVIENERLGHLTEQVLGGDSRSRPIEIRVTTKLRTAATTGILRPVILLPGCWESWSEEDLSAVLAHELNHIHRKDCLSTLCAEVARVLHFYHPLVHWLAGRLRLEQELAADARAAEFVGGQNRYLRVLAEMALNENARAPAWPARAFLPSHRTLIRRIEMLKNTRFDEARASRFWRMTAVCCLGLAAVFAVGLRGQTGDLVAQEPDGVQINSDGPKNDENKTALDRNAPFPLTYVPDDAIAVVAVRPKQLMTRPGLKPLADLIREEDSMAKPFGIPLDQIEQVVWSMGTRDTPRHDPMLIAALIKTSVKLDLEALKKSIVRDDADTGFYGGQLYLTRDGGGDGPSFWLANEFTLILSDSETGLKQAIDARNLAVNQKTRIPAWQTVADQATAGYANIGLLRRTLEGGTHLGQVDPMDARIGTPQQNFRKVMGLNPMFSPLWNDVENVVGHLAFAQGMKVAISAECSGPAGVKKVYDTLNAMLVLGKNMIDQNQQMIGQLPKREQEIIGVLLKTGQEVLKTIELNTSRTGAHSVDLTANLSEKTTDTIVQSLVPAILAAQDAAKRTVGMNNLKNLGLAMHNYHEVYNHMPMPVMMGPDGKTPHSWRVAILPYLDQAALYKEYRLDEPWDSEHNKKLIAKMPAVYRHPKDKRDSTNTSYFALTGKNTLLGDSERNISFRDVTDGTTNTLMIVEAKRGIPWTKPEDIAYDGDRSKPLPELGGWLKDGFTALFGDGSVRFLDQDIDKTTLQNLIERNDGRVVRPLGPPSGSRFGTDQPAGRGGETRTPRDRESATDEGSGAAAAQSANDEAGSFAPTDNRE